LLSALLAASGFLSALLAAWLWLLLEAALLTTLLTTLVRIAALLTILVEVAGLLILACSILIGIVRHLTFLSLLLLRVNVQPNDMFLYGLVLS
jgi:hypothetical protein